MAVDVLVTGASGFVGRHLLRLARTRELEAVAVEGDLRDRDLVRAAFAAARPRRVVHLASAYRREPDRWSAIEHDIRMTGNVLAAAQEYAPDAAVLVAG